MKRKRYIVTIKVTSDLGSKPDVRTLGGDTIFYRLDEGQRATWTIRRDPRDRWKPWRKP